ncbi:phage tail assembly protein [Marinobacter sp. OP 3.4]|uniref:phage tail assembly protein n=1 Tax=Marinobacter sp. OP 3.4 TaxID=3076501 RepID=UPI002E1BAF58
MAEVDVELEEGLVVGEKTHKKARIRELTAGDIFDAQAEAERVIQTEEGPQLVTSPSAVGIHTLRRQIVCIGDLDGPLSLKEMRKLHPVDLELLQEESMKLEQAVIASIASREVAQRGRADEGQAES